MSKASDSSSSSDAGDIPAKRTQKQVAAVEADDEDMSEDEYVVEGIESHKFEKDGTLFLKVKWQGWEERTWEPEEHLDGCPDELKAYFDEIGGKPVFKPREPPASAKKRKISTGSSAKSSPAPTPKSSATKAETKSSAGAGRGRRKQLAPPDDTSTPTPKSTAGSSANGAAAAAAAGKDFIPPAGSWESHIAEVATVMRNDLGRIMVVLNWKDGNLSEHPAPVVHKKAPLKLLQFYESHLQWNNTQSAGADAGRAVTSQAGTTTLPERQMAAAATAAKRISPVKDDLKVGLDDSDVEAEDIEDGIKGVATAV